MPGFWHREAFGIISKGLVRHIEALQIEEGLACAQGFHVDEHGVFMAEQHILHLEIAMHYMQVIRQGLSRKVLCASTTLVSPVISRIS